MDEVGRSDVGHPGTGDASSDDARRGAGGNGDRRTPHSSSAGSPPFTYSTDAGQSDDEWSIPDWTAAERADRTWSATARVWPPSVEPDDNDPRAEASAGPPRAAGSGSHAASDPTDRYGSDPYPPTVSDRATDWYGHATARGAASVPSDRPSAPYDQPDGSADAPRRYPTRERHPSDPYGFAPIDPTIDPLSDAWVSVVEPFGAASPVDTWSDPLPDDRRHASEPGSFPGRDAHPASTSPPAPAPSPVAGAAPAAPVMPAAHAAPEAPMRPDVQSAAWQPAALAGGARGSVPLTDALTAETIEAPLLAAARARPYGEPVFPDVRRPHVFVPRPRASDVHPDAPDDQVAENADNTGDRALTDGPDADRQHMATDAASALSVAAESPVDVVADDRTDAADARRAPTRATAPEVRATIPETPAVVPEARAASDTEERIAQGAAVAAADPRRGPSTPSGSEPGGPIGSERSAAIPMPAGPSDATNASGPIGRGPVGSAPATPAPIAPVPTDRPVDDGPRQARVSGNPSVSGPPATEVPPADAVSAPTASERDAADATSTVRPDIRRRSSWLRAGGSGRAGRFGGRPISMFTSSRSSDASSADPVTAAASDTPSRATPSSEATSTMGARAASDGYPTPARRESWDRPVPAQSGPSSSGPTSASRPPSPYGPTSPPGSGSFEDRDTRRFIPLGQPTLPHRVPAMPDVPFVEASDLDEVDEGVPDLPTTDVDGPELSRIASRLRHEEESVPELPEELDVAAVLAAVRQVHGVRSAQLRPNPGGVHILRLDLADDADAGRVSRQVARLLKERMGLAAEPRRSRTGTSGTTQGSPSTARMAAQPRTAAPMSTATAVPEPPLASTPTRPTAPATSTTAPGGAAMYGSPHVPSTAPGFRPVMPGEPRTYLPGASEIPAGPPLDGTPGQLPRIVLDQVHVSTLGTEATVEVRLHCRDVATVGKATGPAVDAYLLRLAAQAAAGAIDSLIATLGGGPDARHVDAPPVRCFIEHAGVVPFGTCVVAVVVVLASGDGRVEQLVGSALVAGDPRHAIVRATLAAVNRRLESLLA